jgi:SAM-dependent methyltransferase
MTDERRAGAEPGVVSDPAPSSPAGTPQRDSSSPARRRPRALRIPDDEVARPKSSTLDGISRVDPEAAALDAVLTPARIITISSDSIPVDLALGTVPAPPTIPNLPLDGDGLGPGGSTDSERKLRAPSAVDEVEVRFDDVAEPAAISSIPPNPPSSDGERRSDPGDAPEVAAEDLMAVETPAASIPPLRQKLPSPVPVARPAKPAPPSTRPPLVIVPPHVGSMPAVQPQDKAGQRRKARLWWEELFNDDYLHAMERVTDDQIGREVHFIEESLGVERGGALLDLACGTGRHAVELARRGYEVVGLDLSLAMLARAGEDAQERDAKLNFVQGDMRDMTFEEQFDGVYCWNTSFGYFEEEKNAQVVDRIHRALKSGGLFLLDVVNRDFLVRQSPSLAWFEGDGCVCMDEMSVDFITSRMKVKRTMMLDDGRSQEIEYSLRIYSLHELGRVLHEHGFTVREVSGRISTPGVFFGADSPRALILAEKR